MIFNKNSLSVAAVTLSLLLPSIAQAERAVWDKVPINIVLKPGVEKIVTFPSNSVRVKMPKELRESVSTLSNTGVVYWKSLEEFESYQVLVQDKNTQQIIVVNLSSDAETGTDEQLTVMLSEPDVTAESESGQTDAKTASFNPHVGYDELTRTAAKHLYAPNRLVTMPKNTVRVKVPRKTDMHLIRGAIVEMEPLISFNNAGVYVTAVKLTNKQKAKVTLDPRDIRGEWLAATFQHAILGPEGEETDTTSVYLISKRPFWESY